MPATLAYQVCYILCDTRHQHRAVFLGVIFLITLISTLVKYLYAKTQNDNIRNRRSDAFLYLSQQYPEVKLQFVEQYETGAVFVCYQDGFPPRTVFVTNYFDGDKVCDGDVISTNIYFSNEAYNYTTDDGREIRIRGAQIVNVQDLVIRQVPGAITHAEAEAGSKLKEMGIGLLIGIGILFVIAIVSSL